jgi:hypothetical protein
MGIAFLSTFTGSATMRCVHYDYSRLKPRNLKDTEHKGCKTMNAENTKQVGLLAVIGGILALTLSGYGAYVFPYTNVPTNAGLPTLLSTIWQRLVVTITLAIIEF